MIKAFQIILKAAKLLPVVVEIVGDIEEARDPDSPGGTKITPKEIAVLVARGGTRFLRALARVFGVADEDIER